jgi:hypothetical protein
VYHAKVKVVCVPKTVWLLSFTGSLSLRQLGFGVRMPFSQRGGFFTLVSPNKKYIDKEAGSVSGPCRLQQYNCLDFFLAHPSVLWTSHVLEGFEGKRWPRLKYNPVYGIQESVGRFIGLSVVVCLEGERVSAILMVMALDLAVWRCFEWCSL